jgi:large subunit ribosomal protein L22
MEAIAKARNIRMSPRKVRLAADLVRGMSVANAVSQLKFLNKAAALPVLKAVQSAAANAVHNLKLDASGLFVKAISVDGGPTIKRFRPRAFGRAGAIKKRTSHINVVIASKTGAVVPSAAVIEESVESTEKSTAKKAAAKKPAAKKAVAEKASSEKKPAAKKPAVKKASKKEDKNA